MLTDAECIVVNAVFFRKGYMSEELIEAWDWETGKPSGLAVARKEAHKSGIPHEGVHLWIVSVFDGVHHVLLQRRARDKELYPGYLDITVGGHVVFGQEEDKLGKEAREELGINLDGKVLHDLGYIRYEEKIPEFSLFHREFQHVWVLFDDKPLDEYVFEDGEVDGLAAIPFDRFKEILSGGDSVGGLFFNGGSISKRTFLRKEFHPLFFTGPMMSYMKFLVTEIGKMIKNKSF
jgi:isopentenyldiphosphate isomerase